MPLALIDLKNELLTDPMNIGYSVYLQPPSARDNFQLAGLLNQRRVNIQIPREPIPTSMLFSFINATDFINLTALQLQELQVILTMPTIDLNDSSVRQILQAIFIGKVGTLNNFASLRNRSGSRHEQLTSRGEKVSPEYISKALDS